MGQQHKSFDMKIPIKDLANSSCTDSHCEGIVDAATKVVTGNSVASPISEPEPESLNMTELAWQKAGASRVIDKVPAKRALRTPLKGPSSTDKSKSLSTDDEEGNSKSEQAEKADDGVLKKSIILKPVLPTIKDEAEVNAVTTANQTVPEEGKENEKKNQIEKDKVKNIVKHEMEKIEKNMQNIEDTQKNMSKPTISGSVESESTSTDE